MSRTYRYQSYVTSLDPLFTEKLRKLTGKEQYEFKVTTKQIVDIHREYKRIANIAKNYDYVISFACGGIPLLNYVSEVESLRLFSKSYPSTESEVETLHARLKLFPGLLWKGGTAQFMKWLPKIPAYRKILLIDCSFSGGAISTIFNVLATALEKGLLQRQSEIRLDGIIDKKQFDPKKLPNVGQQDVTRADGKLQQITVVPGFVESLLFEDFPALLGFESIRENFEMEPVWSPGALVIENEDNKFAVASCVPFFTSISAWISDPDSCRRRCSWYDKSEITGLTVEAIYIGLRRVAFNEYRKIKSQFSNDKDERTFSGKKKGIAKKWEKDIDKVNELYSANLLKHYLF